MLSFNLSCYLFLTLSHYLSISTYLFLFLSSYSASSVISLCHVLDKSSTFKILFSKGIAKTTRPSGVFGINIALSLFKTETGNITCAPFDGRMRFSKSALALKRSVSAEAPVQLINIFAFTEKDSSLILSLR